MEFEAFKQFLFAEAEANGFEKVELYHVSGSGILLSIPEGEQYNMRCGVSLRGTVQGGTGTAYSEQFTEESARYLIQTVRENASILENDGEAYYHDGSGSYPELPPADDELEDISRLSALRDQIWKEIESYGNLSKTTGVVHAVSSTIRIVNNQGLDVSTKSNYVYCVLYMVAERDGVLKNSLLYRGGTRLTDIDPQDLVGSGQQKANGYFGAEQVESGTYNIVFPNDTASLLVQGFSVFFSAESVLSAISALKGKEGQYVASSKVTILDDPLDPRGVFCRPFDAEGIPAVKRTLVKDGVLESYLHSSRTAVHFEHAQPGNHHRLDYNYQSAVYPSNFYLAAGEKSLDDLIAELGDGLYVTDVTAYFHGAGINAASGEYSIPATGYVVRNGKIERPFDGVTIAGSLYDFMKNIKEVGSDLLFGLPTSFRPGAPMAHGCYGSPSIRVDGITVSGK
ncbi:TldD/PmbA family protein [Paenibacillus senegalensis]|uniref:TldD/PmbA family protein n=1 Tax=Paenibacillus senegalensis TaxID=1465766 RepID=UPI000287EE89|nr:metallopeptidase TldD-related protein [Paenibacillus senegalensis]